MSDPDVLPQTQTETLSVQADSGETSLGWATLGAKRWRCTVGAGGVREDKVEGDAATPAGTFPLRRLYFRNDRLVLPPVRLPARPITEHDGWCDDPGRPLHGPDEGQARADAAAAPVSAGHIKPAIMRNPIARTDPPPSRPQGQCV